MPRQDDSYTSGPAPTPYRSASAQPAPARDQSPLRVASAQTSVGIDRSGGPQKRGLDDLLWYGVCALLGLACLAVLGDWLWRMFGGQIDGRKLTMLIIVVLIYVLCAGCGWLWGRYQNAPVQEELQQQIADLQQQIVDLAQEKQRLQQIIRQQNSAVSRVDPNPAVLTPRHGSAPVVPQVVAPVIPETSIYDQQVEPADRSDLAFHPHEKRFPAPGEQNALGYNWRLIGASRRGYGHGYEGKYREDDFQIKLFNEPASGPAIALVAIADGVSSRELSRKGALASVEGATAISEAQVGRLKLLLSRDSNPEDLRMAAGNILLEALRGAADAVTHMARTTRVSVDELHATLLVFLAAPLGPEQLFLARVQIGDGAMFGVRISAHSSEPPHTRWKQLLAPQIQAAGNEVQPFMRSEEKDWYQFMQFDTLSGFAGVLAMTDGIADDIEPPLPTPGNPEPDEFSMVERFHQTYVVPTLQASRPADELVRFISYRRAQSLDDRTLVYLYHK